MKNVVVVLAVALFSAAMNVNAQEKPKEETKKECSKDKKSCDKEKKAGCCAAKKAAEKKA